MRTLKMKEFISACVVLFIFKGVQGYMSGAPNGVCLSQHASHDNNKHKDTECPYKVSFSSPRYTLNGDVNVTVQAADGAPFKGFLLYAHRVAGDKERPVGEVTAFPEDKARHSPCVTDELVGITHKNNASITSLTFTWRAPSENVGDVVFKHMIVQDFENFWIGLTSDVLQAPEPLVNIPVVEEVATATSDIDWDACGTTKGCFLYPRLCSGSDCKAAVTYMADGEDFVIEMFVSGDEYVAVGFSKDKTMAQDHVHACTGGAETYSVQEGYNPMTYYIRNYRTGLSDMEVRTVDGNTMCRFRRPRDMVVFTGLWGLETVSLNDEYFIFLAWGALYTGTDVISHHTELPVITESLIDLNDIRVVRGSALPVLTQVHATLMLCAWILFVGMATVISRYYKAIRGNSLLFGTKYWFQIHRASGVIAWLLTATAFIIIFVKVKAISELAEIHSYLGIAVMAACTLQILAGILRPDLKSSIRPVFNIGHWLMGKASHILSAVTIYFAFYADIVPDEQRRFGVIATSVWVALQFVWEAIFEFRRCQKGSSKYAVSGDKVEQTTMLDAILLVIYVFTMAGILTALLLAIFLY